MAGYEVNCADGTDANCTGTVTAGIEFEDLTSDQVDDVREGRAVCLTKEQLESNDIDLSKEQEKELSEEGHVCFSTDIYGDTCGSCGSDQDYNAEGQNVTGA